jgi:hypothetical protein
MFICNNLYANFYVYGYEYFFLYGRDTSLPIKLTLNMVLIYWKLEIFCKQKCKFGFSRKFRELSKKHPGDRNKIKHIFMSSSITMENNIIVCVSSSSKGFSDSVENLAAQNLTL